MTFKADPRLIVALDEPNLDAARALIAALGDTVSFYKIGLTLLAQGLRGATIVTPSLAAHSRTRYQAAYLLASLELDRWRLSLRGDVFATRERSPAPRVELSEHGTAMTAAVSYRLATGVRITGEVLRVDSYRLQRTAVQLPAHAVETQAQLAVRLYF